MARPFKTNETPVAPFNLREKGPMAVTALERLLGGAAYRIGLHDKAATQDRDPCPHCGARVIWAPTAKREGDRLARFVYARCAANPDHRWGFTAGAPGESAAAADNAPRQEFEGDLVKLADTLDTISAALRKLSGKSLDLGAILKAQFH